VAQPGSRITLLLLGVLLAPGAARPQAYADRPSAPPLPEQPSGPDPGLALQTAQEKPPPPPAAPGPAVPPPGAPVPGAAPPGATEKVTAPPLSDRPTAPALPPPGRILPRLPHYVFRVQGGIALTSADTFCIMFDSPICPSPGGTLAIWPVVAADFELWWARSLYVDEESLIVEHGVSVGVNVIFGHYFLQLPNPVLSPTVNGTLWEPHADIRWGLPGELFWRFALGVGIYIASATATAPAGRASTSGTGVAFRLGLGVTILPREPVSLAIDFVGEGGWVGSTTILNAQLLIGPEVHFD